MRLAYDLATLCLAAWEPVSSHAGQFIFPEDSLYFENLLQTQLWITYSTVTDFARLRG